MLLQFNLMFPDGSERKVTLFDRPMKAVMSTLFTFFPDMKSAELVETHPF